jgi:hypothetical protein
MNENEFISTSGHEVFTRELEDGSLYISVFNQYGQWLGSNVISNFVSTTIELKTSLSKNTIQHSEVFN